MMDDKIIKTKNPWSLLGLKAGAGDQEIRNAYLLKIKEHPPDKDPETFERIRDAYEMLKDPFRRFNMMAELMDPEASLENLLPEDEGSNRKFVGPEPWLEALKEG